MEEIFPLSKHAVPLRKGDHLQLSTAAERCTGISDESEHNLNSSTLVDPLSRMRLIAPHVRTRETCAHPNHSGRADPSQAST